MSEDNHYVPFEITETGFAYRQKAIAEGCTVEFTRGAIGQGRPEEGTDLFYITGLVDHIMYVPIKESYAKSKNHIMSVVIDGINLTEDIMMTEICIYARLLDARTGAVIMPEACYGYTYTKKYDYIPAGESYNLYREISFNTVLSRDGKFEIVFDKSQVYVTQREFDDFYEENIRLYLLDAVFTHDLDAYPAVTVFETVYGAGMGGCGETPCGGNAEVSELKSRVTHLDSNRFKIALNKKYSGTPQVTLAADGVFTVIYPDAALRVGLQMDYSSAVLKMTAMQADVSRLIAALTATVNGNDTAANGEITMLRSDLTTMIARLSTRVDSNKILADSGMAALGQRIDAVPTGCGN